MERAPAMGPEKPVALVYGNRPDLSIKDSLNRPFLPFASAACKKTSLIFFGSAACTGQFQSKVPNRTCPQACEALLILYRRRVPGWQSFWGQEPFPASCRWQRRTPPCALPRRDCRHGRWWRRLSFRFWTAPRPLKKILPALPDPLGARPPSTKAAADRTGRRCRRRRLPSLLRHFHSVGRCGPAFHLAVLCKPARPVPHGGFVAGKKSMPYTFSPNEARSKRSRCPGTVLTVSNSWEKPE